MPRIRAPRTVLLTSLVSLVATTAIAGPPLRIDPKGYQITDVRQVPGSRTAVDVTARGSVINSGNRAVDVTARLVSRSAYFTALDADLRFGDVPRTSPYKPVLSRDTFKLRINVPGYASHTRTRFIWNVLESLRWDVSCASCGQNRPPIASAGRDATSAVGRLVRLDGTGSTDPEGHSLTYAWSFVSRPAGSQAVLAASNSVHPSFVIDRDGDYIIQLVVNDGKLSSAPDTVKISTRNSPPVAQAGPDRTTLVGEGVALDGSASTDVDGDRLTYQWRVITRPDGSSANIVHATQVMASFTPDAAGQFVIELVVNDGHSPSAPDTLTITAGSGNSRPVANAGIDRSAHVSDVVQLDGSGSSDADGDRLAYRWTLTSRPSTSATTLQNSDTATPTVAIDRPGTYIAQLIVSDGTSDSNPDTIVVTTVNVAPVARPGSPQTAHWGTTFHLDGSASSDPDTDPLRFTWSLLSRPSSSQASFADTHAAAPALTADKPGVYVVQLIVNDGTADSAPVSVSLTATNEPPVAADDSASTTAGASVDIVVLGNDSDADGDPLAVLSVGQPGHGTATKTANGIRYAPQAGFSGTDSFEYTVSDGAESDTATVHVGVVGPQNAPPTASIVIQPPTAQVGTSVTLSFSESTDPDAGDQIVSYVVTLISAPAGSSGGGVGGQRFVVGAPFETSLGSLAFEPDVAGTYHFQLVVRDTHGTSSTPAAADLDASTGSGADVATVSIDRSTVFLPGIGQATVLHATIVNAQGAPVSVPVSWISSQPGQVSVDGTGRVVGLGIGSAQIVAEAGGVRSTPAFALVAEPKPGALLLTDVQIVSVGAAIGVQPGDAPGVGTQYDVVVRNLASPPAPGTVVLAAENAAVAGKVVSSQQNGNTVTLRLALAPLPDLLDRYHIDWSIDLAPYQLAFDPPPAGAATRPASITMQRAGATASRLGAPIAALSSPLDAIACDGSVSASLASLSSTLAFDNQMRLDIQDYRDDPALDPGFSRHALTGSETITGTIELKFNPGFRLEGTCIAQGHVDLPVFGWVSLLVMPSVRLGVGVDLSGEFEVVHGQLTLSGKIGSSHTLGWQCANGSCAPLQSFTPVNEFKHTEVVPSLNDMHAVLSGQAFVLVGLDLAILSSEHAEMIEAKAGPKQNADLGFETDQAENSGYASTYDLSLEVAVQPGSALKTALQSLIGGNVNLTFGLKFSQPLSKSPRGVLQADTLQVSPGNPVNFTVALDADSVNYKLLGYNVSSISLYRKGENDFEFTPFASIPVSATNQTTFQYRWDTQGIDVGKSKFAAFVETTMPVPQLEVNPNSIVEVNVSCFSQGGAAPQGRSGARLLAASNTCADEWTGSSSHFLPHIESSDASVTWQRDPTFQGTGAQVLYRAHGTLTWHHLIFEEGGCSVSPTTFAIGDLSTETNQLIVDYGVTPAAFGGAGIVSTTLTISCPGQDPFSTPANLSWFNAAGTVSDDGLTISGSTVTPQGNSSFNFHRPN